MMTFKWPLIGLFLSALMVIPGLGAASQYGLTVGEKAPAIHQKDINGHPFDLAATEASGPVVLVFYRGGWCPFCNLQLHNLQTTVVPFATKDHARIVAISVDLPTEEAKTQNKHDLTMTLLSDPKAVLLGAYNVQNPISLADYEKYKTVYHVDLEKYSGETNHLIAIPAVFVMDSQNTIVYAHADPDYKVRAPESDIKAAILKASVKS